LKQKELDFFDPHYEVLIGVRAVKQEITKACASIDWLLKFNPQTP